MAGFTLVEILVALLVLSIALAATTRSLGAAVDTTAALRDRSLARWVAEDQLAEIELRGEWPSLDVKEGKSSMAGREFLWRRETTATPYARMRRVDLAVLIPGEDTPLLRLAGYFERPSAPQGVPSGQPGTPQ